MHGESASNPLLPAIAEFWPSVIARLRSASYSLSTANKLSRSELSIRHVISSDQEQGPTRAEEEVLLSKLFVIVSELCLGSDGFFADRFENDVYPIIAALIGMSTWFGRLDPTCGSHALPLASRWGKRR